MVPAYSAVIKDVTRATDLVDLETWTHADAIAAVIVLWCAIKKRR